MTPMTEDFALSPTGRGRWTATATTAWVNPQRGVWGGYAIGLCIRVLEGEPEFRGEPLSVALTYAAPLQPGSLDIATRRLRQGGSIGVWEIEIRLAGSGEICIHAVITAANRAATPIFKFARMPAAHRPEALPSQATGGSRAQQEAFEWRGRTSHPPAAGQSPRTLAWVRSRRGSWDKALLGIVTDASPPRAMHALGSGVMNTTLSLTIYLHATRDELAELGDDFILVEYDGRVGGGGASDECSRYWSRNGRLLATSEQLVWYR